MYGSDMVVVKEDRDFVDLGFCSHNVRLFNNFELFDLYFVFALEVLFA